jgi:serine/threonine protein kinase
MSMSDRALADSSIPAIPSEGPLDVALTRAFGPGRGRVPPAQSDRSVLDFIRERVGHGPPLARRGDGAEPLPVTDSGLLEQGERPGPGGRYRVEGTIAEGGVGAVYEGRDTELDRPVAIKVLKRRHARSEAMVGRFLEEARIEGQLQHPGVVPVHEVGQLSDRRPFFTMKLVEGKTLAWLLENRDSPASDRRWFLTVFEKVLETVAYAHSKGVMHRDLKPSNIMVGAFGEVQVMDWGLSKVVGAEVTSPEHPDASSLAREDRAASRRDGRSETGSVMGTPAYMPPEQARGEVDSLDERSDVFSLGAILCEILTGKPPYAGATSREIREKAEAARLDEALVLAALASCVSTSGTCTTTILGRILPTHSW